MHRKINLINLISISAISIMPIALLLFARDLTRDRYMYIEMSILFASPFIAVAGLFSLISSNKRRLVPIVNFYKRYILIFTFIYLVIWVMLRHVA